MINRLTSFVIVRFVISGGTSAVVDLTLLYILNISFGLNYLLSAILAFIGAFFVSFTLHKFWTFKSHGESAHKQMVMYLGTSLFGLCLNTLLMYIFVSKFDFHVIVAQIMVGGMVAICSFFLSHKLVFKYRSENVLE